MTPENSATHQSGTVDLEGTVPADQPCRPKRNLTPEGRQRLREAALRNKPWQYSTGPRTPEGKARVAQNGRWRQRGKKSKREIRAELAQAMAASDRLVELTGMLLPESDNQGGE
jgi:hypothetical protein